MHGVTFVTGILVTGGRGILAGLARARVHAEGLWTGANFESTGAGGEVGPRGGMRGGSDRPHRARARPCCLLLLRGCDAPLHRVTGEHSRTERHRVGVSIDFAEGCIGAVGGVAVGRGCFRCCLGRGCWVGDLVGIVAAGEMG